MSAHSRRVTTIRSAAQADPLQDCRGSTDLWFVFWHSLSFLNLILNLYLIIFLDLLNKVTEFQKEAKELLEPKDDEQSIVQLDVLQKCLERGAAFGIDLPEIARLKLVIISYFLSLDHPSFHSTLL